MTRKRSKVVVSPELAPVDTPPTDRAALIAAYQAGLITAWKHEGERGYRLTMSGARISTSSPRSLPSISSGSAAHPEALVQR